MNLPQAKNPIDNYKLIYSPRTTYNTQKILEKRLYHDLLQSFDPFTLKILRRHFKEHLGSITKDLFICILKRHLLSWNPNIKNRQKIFIKLLSQLFDEIDLDSDDIINWNEFSNFLVYIGNSRKSENSFYHLRQYFKSKTNFDHAEKPDFDDDKIRYMNINNNDNVSSCFYIAKYRFLGLIHEGKNKIIFFNTENKKRLKLEIDLLSIQDQIDKYEIYEFENKTEEMLQKKEEQKLIHKAQLEEKCKKLFLKLNRKFKSNSQNINLNNINNSSSSENQNSSNDNNQQNNSNNIDNNNKNKKRVSTPNAKKQLKIINLKKNLPSVPKYNNIKTEGNIKRTEKKTYHIVTTLFLDQYNLLFISSTNNIISAWKFKEKEEYFDNVNLISQNIDDPHNKKECIFEKNEILIPLFKTEHTQYAMCFDYVTNNLYTGQTDGKILKWDMTINKPILILDINEYSKSDIILPKLNSNYHKEAKDILLKIGQGELNKILKSFPENKRNTISCLIFIDPLKILCSAHYNGQIILWDIVYNKPKRIYNDQKTGIYQLLYDYNTNHIYSCGFEHDIFIYDPYIDNEAVYRLKGHKSSVKSIALIKENQELLSIDILGQIKIWDTRNLYNFQTMNINDSTLLEVNHFRSREELNERSHKKKISANIHIQTFPDLKKFLIYGEKFLLYEKGNFLNPLLCDDYMIIGSFYNPKTNKIVTISNKNIKFWNILNGQLVRIYSELMNNENENKNTLKNNEYEITSFEYDTLYKKIYLGDSLGRIKSFYLSTGDFIKEFQPHKSEISHIIYSNKYDYLITCSNDLKVKFHKDNEAKDNNYKVIREMKLLSEKKKINTDNRKITLIRIVFDEEKGLLLSCLSNGLIIEFDVEHFKVINEIDTITEFMSLDNMKNIPQITSAEYIKDAHFFFISLDNKYKKLVALKNNKYFNILKRQYIGNFIEDKNNMDITENYTAFKKYAIMCSFYDINTKKLFLGDSFGFIMCYDLTCLFDNLINNDLLTLNDDVLNAAKNNINFPSVFKIELNKEPIIHIVKPEKLIPNILIVVSIDRTVRLVNYNTGEFIDSLKQISINNTTFPIAVRYCIDNPFEKKSPIVYTEENRDINNDISNDDNKNKNNNFNDIDEEEKEKQLKENENNNKYSTIPNINNDIDDEEDQQLYPNIMYRKNVKYEAEIPKIKKHEDRKKELVRYSNAVLLYSVKEKMRIPKYSQEIPENKSTLWKYEVDVEYLKKIDDEQISIISRKIGNKEKEINITETNFQKYSVNAKNYLPKYIKDLSQNEKDKIKESISNKIKDVNLAFNKKAKIKREMDEISKIEKKNIHINTSNNKADLLFINKKGDLSNFFLTPLKPIKTKSVTNKKKKEGSKLPPLIEENTHSNSKEKNNKKQINTNKSYKKLSHNIKIVQSPKKYHYMGNIFKNYSVSNEDKFKEYKNQFDEKINEIMGPIELIKLRKKNSNGLNAILK